ncbi:MAG: transposase [Desulfovibrio sp.]|nr:transposase [Desulfovibrio sp.]
MPVLCSTAHEGNYQSCHAEVKFLPAYSPDLNPIEKMWSKVKTNPARSEAANKRRAALLHRHSPGHGHRDRCRGLV